MSTIHRKVVVVGDYGGKTALAIACSKGTFPGMYSLTYIDKYFADIEVDSKHVELAIWDTGCNESYDRLRPLAYPGAHVVLMCFSIDNPKTLDNVEKRWIDEVNRFCWGIPIILVGLRRDLRRDQATISELGKTNQHLVAVEEGQEVGRNIGAKHYVECSSKTGEGVREVFQTATHEALRPCPKPPLKGFNALKGFLKSSKIEEDMDSLSAPQLNVSEEKELKRLLVVAVAVALPPLEIFRLLIIGKTGCGKTTILNKVCGRNMVDSPCTRRGVHNIEKEIKFEGNSKIVAHDSEGFEAGKQSEVDVVWKFIDSRSRAKDVNQKLHLVWYCMEMNSRPIQQAEKDFFSKPLPVPIVAIVTKFDTFLQDMQQALEEKAQDEDEEVDDDELEKNAVTEADIRFEQHYKMPLEDMQHPPKAIVTLSEVHKSAPDNSRLARLIDETLGVLTLTETERKERSSYDLRTFFATAQNADTKVKLTTSASSGLNWNYYKSHSEPMFRGGPFIKTWETYWTDPTSGPQAPLKLVCLLEEYLDNSRRLIGDWSSSEFSEVNKGDPDLLKICRWEQRVADTTLIMEKVYVFNIKDEKTLEALIKWYDQGSRTATYVRKEIMQLYRRRRSERYKIQKEWSEDVAQPLIDIICNRPVEVPG